MTVELASDWLIANLGTAKGVIGQLISNQPNTTHLADLKLQA